VTNVSFICAKVEDAIHKVLRNMPDEVKAVAILDPPRAGVREYSSASSFFLSSVPQKLNCLFGSALLEDPSVIKTVRADPRIGKIIFVACDAAKSMGNWKEYVFLFDSECS
jgi:hypothetical protein